jgi:enamine deaminase RidA (YjgF/YER057c/UK114 family)
MVELHWQDKEQKMNTVTDRLRSRRRLLGGLLGATALSVAGLPSMVSGAAGRGGATAARLEELGITLPELAAPVASYVPYVVSGNQVFIAGQLPFQNGALLHPGKVPVDVTVEQASEAARQCGVNILAALNEACEGNLDQVARCVRLEGYVACSDDFTRQSLVMNAASGLMEAVFGERGRHTRVAVGTNSLPLNATVEIAGLFVLND